MLHAPKRLKILPFQEKAKKVEEDSPIASLLGSGLEALGVAGRGGALTVGAGGAGGTESLRLHEVLRQLGRLGRLTVCCHDLVCFRRMRAFCLSFCVSVPFFQSAWVVFVFLAVVG